MTVSKYDLQFAIKCTNNKSYFVVCLDTLASGFGNSVCVQKCLFNILYTLLKVFQDYTTQIYLVIGCVFVRLWIHRAQIQVTAEESNDYFWFVSRAVVKRI